MINETVKIVIPAGRYSGYLWASDAKQPEILDKEEIVERELLASVNPFIIEGQLYDENNKKSYTIKYIDGKYYCCYYEVEALPKVPVQTYIPSFDNAPGNLCFCQYWQEEEDVQCLGMKTLRPKELVFVGFKKKEE